MFSKKQVALAGALSALLVLPPTAAHAQVNKNRVAILVDSSGSFRSQAPSAVQHAVGILDRYAERKERRMERRNSDEIVIIALDASPEVIFSGTREELKKIDRSVWVSRFNARKTFGMCTDVVAAFDLAVRFFKQEPQVNGHYIFTYSDLFDEPHAGFVKGQSKCRPVRYEPAANFPWDVLRNLRVQTHLLWLPTEQVLRWKRAIQYQGLDGLVHTYSAAEAPLIQMEPPQPAHFRPATEAENKQMRDQLVGMAVTTGGWVAYGLGILGASAIGLALLGGGVRWLRRNRGRGDGAPTGAPTNSAQAPGRPRLVTGPVPPLNVNRR